MTEKNNTCENCVYKQSNNTCTKLLEFIYPNVEMLDDSGFYVYSYDVSNESNEPIQFCCNQFEQKI